MAYASVIHVEALNTARPPFTADSRPASTQVAMMIDHAAAAVDGALIKQHYAVPITPSSAGDGAAYPTAALLMLQEANAVGAAYMVEVSAQVGPKADLFKTMWDAALEMLATVELPGIPRSADTSLPRYGKQATYIFSPNMQL